MRCGSWSVGLDRWGYCSRSGEGRQTVALILKQCPIGEPAPGKFGRGEAMHQSTADLITAADLVSLNAAALPHDLNGAIPEGQVHVLGRSAASGEGVDQHRVSVSFLDIVARWGGITPGAWRRRRERWSVPERCPWSRTRSSPSETRGRRVRRARSGWH